MTDTDNGRGTQSNDESDQESTAEDSSPECHRRGCTAQAAFLVLERYQEETGHGPVEAEAALCRAHADEESPANLDHSYPEYVFRVEPLQETTDVDTV